MGSWVRGVVVLSRLLPRILLAGGQLPLLFCLGLGGVSIAGPGISSVGCGLVDSTMPPASAIFCVTGLFPWFAVNRVERIRGVLLVWV
jgi:hypothetical protein